jgi:hypothetical protein
VGLGKMMLTLEKKRSGVRTGVGEKFFHRSHLKTEVSSHRLSNLYKMDLGRAPRCHEIPSGEIQMGGRCHENRFQKSQPNLEAAV